MRRQDKEKIKGVYAAFCLVRPCAYIGASEGLDKRFEQHIALLNRNQHKADEMQRDWNLFGSAAFVFFPLEFVQDKLTRCARERAWTKECLIDGEVYNQRNAVTEEHRKEFGKCNPKWPKEPVGASAKEYCFVSPTGELMKVRGLRGICSAYNLNPSHMSKVSRGIYVQHRGWTSKKTEDEVFKKLEF